MFTSSKCHMNVLPHGQTLALSASAGQTGWRFEVIPLTNGCKRLGEQDKMSELHVMKGLILQRSEVTKVESFLRFDL